MLTRRRAGFGIAVVLSGMALVPLIVTRIESLQARTNERLSLLATPALRSRRRVAVVYFSRSGNTALLARHLAWRLGASLFTLQASDYELGLPGWVNAMRDAGKHEASLSPQAVDLSEHDAVYLGSPIWMFSPAPPIWQLVEQNRFDGKDVVLFNTFNSRFKQEFIDSFREKILQRGARSFRHQFVRRGRMPWQLSPDDMLEAFDSKWVK